MARRNRKKKKTKAKHAQQNANKPSTRLAQAIELLKQGHIADADLLAQNVLNRVNDGDLHTRAQQVLAEAAFRQTAAASDMKERLRFLNRALEQAPNDSRLHHHRGLTLLRLGESANAQKEFDWLIANDVSRHNEKGSKIEFMKQALHLAQDQPTDESNLAADEAQLLKVVQKFVNNAPKEEILPLVKSSTHIPKQHAELWMALLDMRDKPKTASQKTRDRLATAASLSPLASYYLGVAALRKKEVQPALDAWKAAANSGFQQPWFEENRSKLLRECASEMAKADRWHEIIELTEDQINSDGDKVLVETVAAAHFHVGYDAVQRNNWPLALSHWQLASELKQSRQLAQNLAIAYEKQEDWPEAAQTWREMVRRRPRKESHPDYLSDSQVAVIWTRAGACYHRAELETDGNYFPLYEEKLTCYKNAVKYDPQNLDLRMQLVLAYLEEERNEAAENELERVLEIDPDNVPALLRLGILYDQQWGGKPLPLWERALELEPNNVDARNAVASAILDEAGTDEPRNWFARLNPLSDRDKIKKLKAATERIPNHPKLLFSLGVTYLRSGKNKDALQALTASWDADQRDPNSFGRAMHELLHVKGGDKIVEERLPSVRAISGLHAHFWLEQSDLVRRCELDEQWIPRFWDEAVLVAENDNEPGSLPDTLIDIMDFAMAEGLTHLSNKYETRIKNELSHTGAAEYLEVIRLREREADPEEMLRVLRRAKKKAKTAGEAKLLERIEAVSDMLSNPLNSIMNRLGALTEFDPFADDDDDFDINPEELLEELLKDLGKRR